MLIHYGNVLYSNIYLKTPPSPGVLQPTSGLWPQFLGRALAALRSIGMTIRHMDGRSAY
jgi:hypothetical protein